MSIFKSPSSLIIPTDQEVWRSILLVSVPPVQTLSKRCLFNSLISGRPEADSARWITYPMYSAFEMVRNLSYL